MSKDPIYRIRVEVIGEEKEEYKIGEDTCVDCDGFVIMGHRKQKDEPDDVYIHNISNIDIATMIACNRNVMAASLIAKAMREAREIIQEDRNPLADLLKAAMKK